jgi:hypothetical protein
MFSKKIDTALLDTENKRAIEILRQKVKELINVVPNQNQVDRDVANNIQPISKENEFHSTWGGYEVTYLNSTKSPITQRLDRYYFSRINRYTRNNTSSPWEYKDAEFVIYYSNTNGSYENASYNFKKDGKYALTDGPIYSKERRNEYKDLAKIYDQNLFDSIINTLLNKYILTIQFVGIINYDGIMKIVKKDGSYSHMNADAKRVLGPYYFINKAFAKDFKLEDSKVSSFGKRRHVSKNSGSGISLKSINSLIKLVQKI